MLCAARRFTLLTASLLAAAGAPSALFHGPPHRPQAPPTGAIAGNVVLSRAITTRRPQIRLYSDFGPGQVPPARSAAPNELLNVVVYIDSAPLPPASRRGQPAPAIRQQNEAFVPHVLVVPVGTRVEFPNEDPFFHNVFSLSQSKSFDLGRYPKGQSKAVVFDRPGIVQVFCHIHSDMSAIVLVRPNPYFAMPDSTGQFRISDVPPGTYRLVGWHERANPVVHEVRVVAGQTTRVDFNIPVTAPPGRGEN